MAAGSLDNTQIELIHRLLDLGYAIVKHQALNRVVPTVVAQTRSNILELEAELRRKGIPLGERKTPVLTHSTDASFADPRVFGPLISGGLTGGGLLAGGGAVVDAALEVIAAILIGVGAALFNVVIFLVWRNTLGRVYELYFKTARDAVREINAEVAGTEVRAAVGSCKKADFDEFFTLSDKLIQALQAVKQGSPRAAAEAWSRKLGELFSCLPNNIIEKTLNIWALCWACKGHSRMCCSKS